MIPRRSEQPARARSAAYGGRLLPLLAHGLRDRLQGAHGRANARWGHLRPPPGRGRVLWLKAGADEESVRLGAELLAAIRHKRLDLRLVLTFETDYPPLVDRALARLEKVGAGYGPCDAPRAVRRALDRLAPLAIIWTGTAADTNLLAAARAQGCRALVVDAPAGTAQGVEAAYPATPAQARTWAGARAGYVAPVADLRTLLTQAQAEPTLRSLMGGGGLRLWWCHGGESGFQSAFIERWCQSPLATDGVLLVSPTPGAADLTISAWDRRALGAGTVVAVDEPRWYPAVAVAARAQYLAGASAPVLWQSLAAGTPAGVSPALAEALEDRMAAPPELAVAADPDAVMAWWSTVAADDAGARRLGDACRRRFWDERRRAGQVRDELLQRVFDW